MHQEYTVESEEVLLFPEKKASLLGTSSPSQEGVLKVKRRYKERCNDATKQKKYLLSKLHLGELAHDH